MKRDVLILILFATLAKADKGMIPVIPNVSVYEPGQKAIIGWNGDRKIEIMILAVDAYADTECKVLEIMPLPSEPKVDTGSVESFEAVQRLIMKHAPKPPYRGKGILPAFEGTAEAGVEILFHKKIGAHNITCTKALKYQEFVDWTYNFIKSQHIDTIALPAELPYIIQEYLRQEIIYFVFDIVELGKNTHSVAPLIYEFTSPYLYFPLRISRLAKGNTKIQLFLLSNYPPWPPEIEPFEIGSYETYRRRAEESEIVFKLTREELKTITPLFLKLFSNNVWFTALKFEGPTASLRNDLTINKFCKIIMY